MLGSPAGNIRAAWYRGVLVWRSTLSERALCAACCERGSTTQRGVKSETWYLCSDKPLCVTERDACPSSASDAVSQQYQMTKKAAKSTAASVLTPGGQVQLSRTAENLHAYLETRAPTLSLGIAIQSVIGFVRIRTGDPFGVLGELNPRVVRTPTPLFQMVQI